MEHPALDRLNDTERELFSLLGQGHTAKSIATLKGLSVPAVNERFRNARRKTGLASSREIARLVVAQENRDDFIGLAEPVASPPDLPRPDAPRSRRASPSRRWRLPMVAAGLIAVALFAQQTALPTAPPVSQARPDTVAASALFARRAPEADLTGLHAEIISGPQDLAWSPITEAALTQHYRQTPGFNDSVESFSVVCTATLCEVLGTTKPGLPSDRFSALLEQLQAANVERPDADMRLDHLVNSIGTTTDDPASFIFVAYWRRRD